MTNYLGSVRQLLAFLEASGMPVTAEGVSREHVETFLIDLRDRTSAVTANTRRAYLFQFFAWLAEEGERQDNPVARIPP